MELTVKQTVPLNDLTLFNPDTGRYEIPHLTIEMEPSSLYVVSYRLDFENEDTVEGR